MLKTTDVLLSEFIGYQTRPLKQNYCIISFARYQSSKPCDGFSIFPLVVLQFFCHMNVKTKNLATRVRTKGIVGGQF